MTNDERRRQNCLPFVIRHSSFRISTRPDSCQRRSAALPSGNRLLQEQIAMTQMELSADVLTRNLEMLRMTLADFSDADMLVRPCPGANHAAWQLGHLTAAETRMTGMFQ